MSPTNYLSRYIARILESDVESYNQSWESEQFLFILRDLFSAAYKHADGKKIDGRRVLVDVERARTVKGWLPRRLGG